VLVKTFGDSDKMTLFKWLAKRDVDIEQDEVPGHGYMVSSIITKEPIACGFLREQGSLGFIEGFTTNPDATSEERNEAMDDLTTFLLTYAKRRDIKRVIGYSLNENIVKRAVKHGFIIQPHVMFSINLGE
jgi:hypothetical protein